MVIFDKKLLFPVLFGASLFILSLNSLLADETPPLSLNYLSEDLPSSSVETPSFFRTVIDTRKKENKLKSTQEIIDQTVGVDVESMGSVGSFSTVSIRGSSSDQVLILLDGTKLNSPSAQSIDLSSLPVSMAGKIEILRGGSSAEFGEGPIGGVINIVPDEQGDKRKFAMSLKAGSFSTVELGAFYREEFNRLKLLSSSSVSRSLGNFEFVNTNGTPNNYADDYVDTRQNNGFASAGNFTKLRYSFSENVRAAISNEFYYSTRGVPGTLAFPSLESYQNDTRAVSSLDIYFRKIFKKTDLKLSSRANMNWLLFEDPRGELTGHALITEQTGYDIAIDSIFDNYALDFDLITLSMGAEFAFMDQELQNTDRTKPFRSTTHWIIKNQINVWRKYLMISPIVRLDWVYEDKGSFSDHDLVFSPKIGFTSQVLKELKIKSNVGSSYRYPNFKELYFSQGFVDGNPDLKRERAINFDIGLKYTKGRLFFAELVYFLNSVNDLIVYEQISNFRYKPLNIGSALIQGAEFSCGISPTDFISFTLNSTFLDPRNRTDEPNKEGNLLPGRPQGKTNLRLSLLMGAVQTYGELQAISENFVNEANTVKLGARYLFNAGISYSLGAMSLSIDIKNILNDQIEDVRGFPLPGFSFMSGITIRS